MKQFSCTRRIMIFAAIGFLALSMLGVGASAAMAKCSESGSSAEKRVALVIGNGAYAKQPLANPGNDARAISAKLQELGFRVIACENLNLADMQDALRRLGSAARGAEIAAVYFAGHGAERRGKNFLIPTDAKLDHAADLALQAMPLDIVLDQLAGASKLRLVLLDACRNNPFPLAGEDRSASRGLSRPPEEDNTLIAYAAKDGTLAADGGTVGNSPFAAALLKHMATPNLDIRLMLGKVRDDVRASTRQQQTPHVYGTLGGESLPLVREQNGGTTQPSAEIPQKNATIFEHEPVLLDTPAAKARLVTTIPILGSSSAAEARLAWNRIETSMNRAELDAFRRQFGRANPFYDEQALKRIASLDEIDRREREKRTAEATAKAEAERVAAETRKADEEARRRPRTVVEATGLTGGQILSSASARSPSECDVACEKNRQCIAAEYDAVDKRCTQLSKLQKSIKSPRYQVTFFDASDSSLPVRRERMSVLGVGLKDGEVISFVFASGMPDCEAQCEDDRRCIGAEFDYAAKRCTTYSKFSNTVGSGRYTSIIFDGFKIRQKGQLWP